jgi:DNA-directed RNA polymerase subunit M/transcription elongation factor TFIIS
MDKMFLINCPNDGCHKQFKMKAPAKAGIFKLECPFCHKQFALRIDESQLNGDSSQKQSSQPDYSSAEVKKYEGLAKVNEPLEFKCPHCKKQPIRYIPKEVGIKGFACPLCHGKIAVEATGKTVIVNLTDELQLFNGKLTMLRKVLLNKSFKLKIGSNIVGREDPDSPSDISIPSDNTVSRRSIDIVVTKKDSGYVFKLKVLKATNPVLLNNKPLSANESVSLNFGDSITLGKTKFRFEKDA